MQAQRDYIIIKRKAAKKTTKGGLLLPEQNARPNFEFEVVSVGDWVRYINVGDTVSINVLNAHATIINDEELFFVKEEDVVAKL